MSESVQSVVIMNMISNVDQHQLQLQQNSFNTTSNNPKILLIRSLGTAVQDQFCFFYQKSFITETERSQGHVQEVLQEWLYINCCGTS